LVNNADNTFSLDVVKNLSTTYTVLNNSLLVNAQSGKGLTEAQATELKDFAAILIQLL
jgi:hypothetical protein